MKKILSLLSVLIIALTSLTSCDEDVMISHSLEGVWYGKLYTYYEYKYGTDVDVTHTEISFDRDIQGEYTSGTGYWTDYYYGGDYSRYRIYWNVEKGHIYINFRRTNSTIDIYDYKLDSNHFRGSFKDGVHTYTDFDLTKVKEYEYYGDEDYYYNYAKKTRISIDSLNVMKIE